MLNADMALVSDFEGEIDASNGFVSCNPNVRPNQDPNDECPVAAETMRFVILYSEDEGQWQQDFMNAMVKMTNRVPGDFA